MLGADQIGRIFAIWVNVYFGQFFENYRSGSKFLVTFFHDVSYVLIMTKKWVGQHFLRLFH
jgi:hypothetical protein